MGFIPGAGGGGGGSIAGASDVSLDSVQKDEVLAYDDSASKWQNAKPKPKLARRNVAASHTVDAADSDGYVLHVTANSPVTITLPSDAVEIADDTVIQWRQYGDGQISFVADTGASLLAKDSKVYSAGKLSQGYLVKSDPDTWMLFGELTDEAVTPPDPEPTQLDTPVNLVVTELSAVQLQVTCDAVDGAEEYHWGVRNSADEVVDPVGVTTAPLFESAVLTPDTYTYWVKASKASGELISEQSAEVTYELSVEP